MALSILDQAAEVREKARATKDLLTALRHDGKEWISLSIGSEEAEEIARSGLRHAWTMLDRIYQLALIERDRTQPEPPQ